MSRGYLNAKKNRTSRRGLPVDRFERKMAATLASVQQLGAIDSDRLYLLRHVQGMHVAFGETVMHRTLLIVVAFTFTSCPQYKPQPPPTPLIGACRLPCPHITLTPTK